ncbi:MAG: hypothetical protein JSW65_07730, partial [Candidatus Bipolaricaulota bacterium]
QTRTLLRCFTPTIREYYEARNDLSAEAVTEIEGYLAPKTSNLRATYDSPDGLFEFTYTTTGGDAVPATDVDPANGIPDRVERCAEYADYSWHVEIDTLGFCAPALPTDGTYDVSFASMGAYGYTTLSGYTTRIVLHNTFIGFPPNDDPDGNALGAAKVTMAHEFKHASQFTNSNWSEGDWVELDATWMEDIVFDGCNDYYNYINQTNGGSQLANPELPLDYGGGGSYEDCLWQHYLSETYGNAIVLDVWDLRAANSSVTMKNTYQTAQGLYGTEWDESYPKYMEWCWFTGSRAEPPFGFDEAGRYLRMVLRESPSETYPCRRSDQVDQLAAHARRFNPGAATGYARVIFNGDDAHENFTVSVICEEPDGTFSIVQPTLDGNQDCDYTVTQPWTDLLYVGVIVTNSRRSGGNQSYTLQVLDDPGGTGVSGSANANAELLTLLPNRPNPSAGPTAIRYSVPAPTRGSVRVYDVAGRLIRTLHEGTLPAGRGEIIWDTRNQAGELVPAGVYWSRVETERNSAARKLMLVR